MRVQTGDFLGSAWPMNGLGNYVQDMRPALHCLAQGTEYAGNCEGVLGCRIGGWRQGRREDWCAFEFDAMILEIYFSTRLESWGIV